MHSAGIIKIWHYKRKVVQLRAKAGLPELYDPDDLPDPVYDPNYVHVLTEQQQIDLHYRMCLLKIYLASLTLLEQSSTSSWPRRRGIGRTARRPTG